MDYRRSLSVGFISIAGLATLCSQAYVQSPSKDDSGALYRDNIAKWRKGVEADLLTDEGWLSVAGLFWLQDGETTLGTDSNCGIVFPTGSAPGKVGTLTNSGGKVSFTVETGATATINGQAIDSRTLAPDSDRVQTGSVTWMVIRRGNRIGVRLFDKNSKGRREFKGCKWYPVDLRYRIMASYTAYPVPQEMPITNVLGDTQPVLNPGYVTFAIKGKEFRLEAQAAGNGFFFNFKDLTSGNETYPAGRFLDAPGPVNGKVLLDFNRATNPPCAFTAYATCPLPPRSNYLEVRIPAGEKTHHPAEK
ncbi:MAG: DUF1684 domain-containing protein [Fimbriimonas sp.]|nr:DUF1684 domain-containing protein [Fimbriimonas sp.]